MSALPLDAIKIGLRCRQDHGDIAALAQSIEAIGLLHPVVVTPSNELVCGERRIEAVRLLGWQEIPVRVVNIEAIVFGEQAENELRKDFTMSERVAIGRAVEESLGERRGRPSEENPQHVAEYSGRETRDIAAGKSGFGNAETYRQAKAIVEKGTPELVEAVDRGDVSIRAAAELSRLPVPEQREIVAAGSRAVVEAARDIRSNGVEQFRSPMPKFTGDFEWYTPVEYIELAVEVMGAIDCDPASCADANKIVGAEVFYSQDDDGLKQEWHGRVWLNPPYATDLIRPFTSLLLEKYARGEIAEAIVLTNNVTETLAIQTLMRSCHAICFPEGRIKFYKTTDPERANGAGHGQALFYFGKNASKFRHVFGRKGEIVLPWREDTLALIGLGAVGGSP